MIIRNKKIIIIWLMKKEKTVNEGKSINEISANDQEK